MTHDGVDKLMRDAVARERRIRDLEADLAETDRRRDNMFQLANLLSADLSRAQSRIAELEHVERAGPPSSWRACPRWAR